MGSRAALPENTVALRLQEHIQTEAVLLNRFMDLLAREESTLVEGEADALPQLTEEKAALANELAELGRVRNAILLELTGQPVSQRTQVEVWFAAHPECRKVHKVWQAWRLLAGRAKLRNRFNEDLLNSRLQANQQALTVLFNAANQSALYDPNGRARASASGRTLANA